MTNWGWARYFVRPTQSIAYKINPDVADECTSEVQSMDPYINKGSERSIHFWATADTQYEVHKGVKPVADRTIATMRRLLNSHGDRRGYIVAGDLVERADLPNVNYDAYINAFGGHMRYVFDGLGNHDLHNGWESIRDSIRSEIDQRRRVSPTIKRRDPSTTPDYSWNWDDVHFVQMNHFPGSPRGGLAWLKYDLEFIVENSGNPVVMIHHYGFDGFSRQSRWWSDQERKNYWEVIKGYNIVAIITGHWHNPPPSDVLLYWEGDSYLNGRKIPYFVAGAARDEGADGRGLFLDVTMNRSSMTVIRRYGDDGSVAGTASVDISARPFKKSSLVGSPSRTSMIFDNIPSSGSVLTVYPFPAVNELHIHVLREYNGRLIEGVEIYDKNWNQFDIVGSNLTNSVSNLSLSISQLPPDAWYLLRVKLADGVTEERKFRKNMAESTTFNIP